MTAVPPKADVHPRSCYVANAPADINLLIRALRWRAAEECKALLELNIAKAAGSVWPESHIAKCSNPIWKKVLGLRKLSSPVFCRGRGVMLGASADSRLSVWKRRLLGTVLLGAFPLSGGLTLPEPAWGQASETLPEVTVTAPRPAPKPPRRAAPARTAPAAARPATPPAALAPAPAAALPAFQVVAPTP
jgi:hypothetical protein